MLEKQLELEVDLVSFFKLIFLTRVKGHLNVLGPRLKGRIRVLMMNCKLRIEILIKIQELIDK